MRRRSSRASEPDTQREQAAGQGLREGAGQVVAGAREVGLQLHLLPCRDLVQQVHQALGLRSDLRAVQVQVFVGVLAFDKLAHLQGQVGQLGAQGGDAVEVLALFAREPGPAGVDGVPQRAVGDQLRAVHQAEVVLARGAEGHHVGRHRVERTLQRQERRERFALLRVVGPFTLLRDHLLELGHHANATCLHLDAGQAQGRAVAQAVLVQREEMGRQRFPAFVVPHQALDARMFVGRPRRRQLLKGRERLLELDLRRVVPHQVVAIGQHQVAAQVQLHAQQRLLGLCGSERGRGARGRAQLDLPRRVASAKERERHHQQRQADEDAEADVQLGADAQRAEAGNAAHAGQNPSDAR
jgi:hypothetical protein